jgi:translation initiation factor IF-2
MRVYEIAREVGIPNKDLLAKIRALGLEVNNHMSSIDADDVVRIKRSLEKERAAAQSTETHQLSAGAVLRRRSNKPEGDGPAPVETRASAPAAPTPVPVVRRRVAEPSPVEARPAPAPAPEPRPAPVEERPVRVAAPEPRPAPVEARPTPPAPAPVAAEPPPPARAPTVEAKRPVEPAAPAPSPIVVEEAPPPAPRPAPRAPVVEAAPEPTPAPSPPPVVEEQKPIRPRVVAGPQIVGRPSSGPSAAPSAPSPGREQRQPEPPPSTVLPPRAPVVVRGREPGPGHGHGPGPGPAAAPTAPVDVAGTARSRFEAELEKARARTAEREPERESDAPAPAPAPAPVIAAPTGRPAVGTIISLPPRIKITERGPMGRAPTGAPPPNPGVRGRFAQQQQRPGGMGGKGPGGRNDFGKKKLPLGKKGKQTQLTTPAEHKRVIRIEDTIAIADLARQMSVKAPEVLKKLWGMGMTGVNINASIDLETAQILASEFGYEVQNVAFKEEDIFADQPDDADKLAPRSPVVTVMGHVDHGKTSLLDAIRKARVAAGEAGGITQHIAAYKVAVPNHGDIVFLDTPGHEAFTEMRARGAQATDIVVLVVAANDGVMPQTVEALTHAKDAKVPIIVAVNKIDLPDAQPERVRQQLADHALIPEEWGGDTIYVNVSALRGEQIPKLLESIAVSAEMLELRANPDKPANGLVIEARLDRARGPMATVLVQEGTVRVGDMIVAGRTFGKVRALLDDRGESVKEAGPSTPVEVLGLDGVPEAGDLVNVAEDEKAAKTVVEHRRQQWRKKELGTSAKVSLENIMERMAEGDVKELKIVLKADVQGSAEALKAALTKLTTEKVKVTVISAAVGGITESDVNLAKAGGAVIVGFHVRPAGKSSKLAEQEGVQIKLYDIIYDALDEVRAAMAGLLAPIKREVGVGKAEVRQTFTIPKIGTIAGCMVTDGKVTRRSHLRVVRDAVQVYEGKVATLRRFKDDASEVQHGFECGIQIAGWNEVKPGDVIEAYEVIEEAAKL